MEALHVRLRELAHGTDRLAVACSGGLDSRFLAFEISRAGLTPELYHVTGPHVPQRETAQCIQWAELRGFSLHLVSCDPLRLPEVAANGPERCYACKRGLFSRLYREVGNSCLCDGSNASDLQSYRPGLRALRELDIKSPLADAGLDKPTLRRLACEFGLEEPDQPSRPCLLTRFAYGVRPTAASLARIEQLEEQVEDVLKNLFPQKLPDFRVRVPAEEQLLVQISLQEKDQQRVQEAFASAGLAMLECLYDSNVSGYFDRHAEMEIDVTVKKAEEIG